MPMKKARAEALAFFWVGLEKYHKVQRPMR